MRWSFCVGQGSPTSFANRNAGRICPAVDVNASRNVQIARRIHILASNIQRILAIRIFSVDTVALNLVKKVINVFVDSPVAKVALITNVSKGVRSLAPLVQKAALGNVLIIHALQPVAQ